MPEPATPSPSRRRWRSRLPALLVVVIPLLVLVAWLSGEPDHRPFRVSRANAQNGPDPAAVIARGPHANVSVTIGGRALTAPLPAGFVGFSLEYQSVAVDAGPAGSPDPLFGRLLRAVGGNHPVLRIGGDSADHTYWPGPAADRAFNAGIAGLTNPLSPAWRASVASLTRRARARLLVGLDLEVGRPEVAAAEATALEQSVGRGSILGWEIGNEPNLYGVWPWVTPTTKAVGRIHHTSRGAIRGEVFARPKGYAFPDYVRDFATVARQVPGPLAGPALGSPQWMNQLPLLLHSQPRMGVVTYHGYPMNCHAPAGTPAFPSIADLLSPTASVGLAAGVAGYAREAARAGRSFRIDELNSSACGGQTGVSNTFASALWATDALFAMAANGVSGVNIQDFNGSRYKPFSFTEQHGRWTAQVAPLYYGLMLFHQAAPTGSRLLALSHHGSAAVQAWAAQQPGAARRRRGPVTVTLVNNSTTLPAVVHVAARGRARASLIRMVAPSARATTGVSLAGRSYGAVTDTAELSGRVHAASVSAVRGRYTVALAPASAALLTLKRR